jgi:hypothetical protein
MHRQECAINNPDQKAKAISPEGTTSNAAFHRRFLALSPGSKNLGFSPVAKVIPPVTALFTAQGITINLPFTKTARRVRRASGLPPFTAFLITNLLETP